MATERFSDELPVRLIPAVNLAVFFLALGIATLIAPRQRLLVDLYATDQSLIRGLGASGLVLALALAASAYFAVSAAWPRIVEFATRLPPADKHAALSVLVATLDGDDSKGSQTERVKGSLEHALIHAGSRGPRVQILEAGRILKRGASSDVYQQHEIAEAKGRKWLSESGADVLVWGYVVADDNRIFFLLSEGVVTRKPKESYSDPGFYLPKDFNEDLGDAIAARMVAATSPAFETGKFVADLLDKIYPRLEALATNKVISDSQAFCEVKSAMGVTSGVLGEQKGDNKRLQEAIDVYREVLASSRCTTDKDFTASIHNNLGTALTRLGERESGTAWLEEAVTALRGALKVYEDAGASYYVDIVRGNLTRAQSLLAERLESAKDSAPGVP